MKLDWKDWMLSNFLYHLANLLLGSHQQLIVDQHRVGELELQSASWEGRRCR